MIRFRRKVDVYEAAMRQKAALLRGEKRNVRRMLRLYEPVRREIRARLDEITKTIAALRDELQLAHPEDSEELRRLIRNRLSEDRAYRKLLDDVNIVTADYQQRAAIEITDQQRASIARGVAHASKLADAVGLQTSFVDLHPAAVEHLAGYLANGAPLSSRLSQLGRRALSTIEEHLVSGLALGDNPRTVARLLQKALDFDLGHSAVTIARNESIRAYTQAQMDSYTANGDVIACGEVVSARDARTCLMCWAQDGEIVQLGTWIYRHVTCRCAVIPRPKFGALPPRALGVDAFAELSEAEQRHILGPGRLALYQGGMSLKAMYQTHQDQEWGNVLRLRSLAELRSGS